MARKTLSDEQRKRLEHVRRRFRAMRICVRELAADFAQYRRVEVDDYPVFLDELAMLLLEIDPLVDPPSALEDEQKRGMH